MRRANGRAGLAVGDALLVLSVLALALALAYPRIQAAALKEEVEGAVANVQAVVDAAKRFRAERDRWPVVGDAGATAAALAPYLPPGFSFDQDSHRLGFDVWETVEEAPPAALHDAPPLGQAGVLPDTANAPPTTLFGSLAGVTVHSAEPAILAGLLDRFGTRRSFLHDGAWTLIFASVPGR